MTTLHARIDRAIPRDVLPRNKIMPEDIMKILGDGSEARGRYATYILAAMLQRARQLHPERIGHEGAVVALSEELGEISRCITDNSEFFRLPAELFDLIVVAWRELMDEFKKVEGREE